MLVGEVFARMGLDSKQYEKSLDRLENVTKKRALTLGNIFQGALSVTLGMSFFEAVKTGFKSAISVGIGFNSMLQTARIGFSTMLGDAQKAEVFLSQLADFARDTPFEFPELLEASNRMLAYGFAAEEILPTLRAVGDTAAGLGAGKQGIDRITTALGQIRAKGKLSAEEMRQLTEAGVPAWDMLAEAMGKTVPELQDMVSKGLIPGYKAVKMLTAGMNKRFGGMMKQMENSWQGVTSAIADIWNMTIGEISKNLFERVNEWLIGVKDFAQRFYDALRAGGIQNAIREVFGNEAASAFSIMSAAVKGAWNIVSGFFNLVRSNWNIFGPLVKGALLLYTSFKFVTLATTAAKTAMVTFTLVQKALAGESLITSGILGFVSKAMGIYRLQMHLAAMQGIVLTGVLAKVRVALYSVWTALGPIGWAILAIAGALGIGIGLWNRYANSIRTATQATSPADLAKGFRDIEQSSQAAADGIGEQTDAMKDANKAAGKNIQSFDEVHQVQEDMGDVAGDMALDMPTMEEMAMPEIPSMEEMMAGIGEGLEQAKPTLAGFWDWIKQGFANAWGAVSTKVSEVWGWISTTLGDVWNGIATTASNIWNGIATTVVNVWNWLSGLVSGIFGPIGEFISTTWNNLLVTTTTIWDTIWTTLSTIWNDLLSTSSTIFGAIWTFISDTWNNLWATVSTVWNLIWTFLSGLWNNIWATAGTIWKAIADLITGKIDLRTAVAIIWNAIVTFFTTTWESIRSTASGIWEAIAGFIIGTWEGLKTTASTIWNAITTFFSNTWNSIKNAVEVIWDAIKTFFITTWENLKETALTVWQTIEQYIVDPIRRAWDTLKEIWGNIKSYILGKWDEIKQGITNTAQSLIDAIKSPFIKAKEWILGLIEEAKEWGKNLINNIIDGVKSTAGKVKDAVLGIFSGGSGSSGGGGGGKSGGTIRGFSSKEQEKGYDKKMRDAGAPSWLFHDGGWVGTSGSKKFDEIMALLQTGEFVVSRKMIENIERAMPKIQASPTPTMTTAQVAPEIHLHVGALIADDYGLKKLEQRLRNIRIYEDQRVGDTR